MKKLQRGLPKGKYSKYGYKRNSPDVNKPFNIIPSGRITMQDVDFPVRGVDNLGNEMLMVPGGEYFFPGDYVIETPLMQRGGPKFQQYTPAAESTGANYTPTYFAGTLPEVMVSSDDTSYPYYNKLTAEEKKYFNQNSPIGRAVRSIAFTGKRGKTANDLGKIARGVEEFAAEMTGIPGSIRFSQDPVKKLKGLGRTVEATILGSSPFITAPYNKEDVADTFDALDALGFATTTAGLAKMPLQKAANLTGRYLTQGPLKNAYRLNPVAAKQPTEVILSRVQRPGQTADLSRLDELLQRPPESLTLAERVELARINQPGYGRGFSSNPNDISYYSSPGIQSSRGYVGMPEIRSIRLPAEEAARFNIRQNPVEGYFSGAPGREYLLPRNYVESSKTLTPQTFEELEQIRRLTDAETTALNTPHWWRGYPRINTPKQLPGSSNVNSVVNTAKNLEDLKAAQQFAQQYGYELPINIERIAQSNQLTDRTIRGMMDRHNTFVRGVSTNWDELGKRNPEILRHLEGKGFDLSTKEGTQAAAEYMATHIPINTGYGRASLNNEVFDRGMDGLYTSNSIPTAEGYTYGQGFITKAKRPTNYSSSNRQDWISQNNPYYRDEDKFRELMYPLSDEAKYAIYSSKQKSWTPKSFDEKSLKNATPKQKAIKEVEYRIEQLKKDISEIEPNKDKFVDAPEVIYSKKETIKQLENDIKYLNQHGDELLQAPGEFKILRTERSDLPTDPFNFLIQKEGNAKKMTEWLKTQPYQQKMREMNDLGESLTKYTWEQQKPIRDKIDILKKEANEMYNQSVQDYMKVNHPDYDPVNKYAHYIHLGTPGEKVLQPIKSWEITPEIWKNKSRSHTNKYSKKFSAMSIGGMIAPPPAAIGVEAYGANQMQDAQPTDSKGLFKVIDNDPQKLSNMFNRLWGVTPVAVAGAAAASEKKYGGKLPKYQDKGSVQPRKNNKIYSFLGDMIDSAEKATNETSKFLGDILAPITPDYKTEEEREMLFRRHRPVPYPGIVAGLKDIYIDYTNKKTGNPYLDNFIQNYTVEQKKPFLDEKGDYNIAEEAWRMSLGLPVKNKYIKKSNYRPLDEKDKNSKYYTLNNVIDYDALRNKVKELKIKPGNFVQMESLSPFIKDKFMNKEEFAEIDPLQRFKLGVNKKGKMYIWDKYDFNFAPLQKVIEPYQYEFYDEFQNGGMIQRKDLPKAQSLGEFIPSWANPMNWNVEDYSDKTDFNKAYSAAKKAGKEEFMFNGKRYNTKYAGTPRQEVGVYGVQGKPVHHMNLNDPAQVNLYPAFGKYLPGHISASIGDNQTSVDYSRIGNYPYGINKVKNKGEKSFNVYGQDNLTFSNKVASLPTGNYLVEDEYRPSDWNLFTNNCADNVCDAFGIPRSKDIQTPKAAMQKIQKKYPTLDVTGRTYDDYYDLGVKLRPISFHRPDEVLNQTKNLVGILSSPDLNNTKASEKITFALQNALLKKGYKLPKSINKDGELDGILGDETKAALEDWQKKNSKKQLGGALLKAQFGAFGTIPTSPPFMPQKENVVTFKKVDNSPKIKVNTTVPDEMITIKDGRKIRLTTGQAVNPNTDLVGKSYPTKTLRSILDTAKNKGLSKDDALTLAAMDLQETRWGETDESIGHVLHGNDFAKSPVENFINAYLKSKETADRLKLSDEYTRLQVYNGLGTVTPDTEKDYHGFRMKKIYGVPVPASGINMRKNPLYGKQIVDIRDNVLKQNPEFLKLVDEYYKMGGVTNEMLDVYKNYINGVYTNTEKEKDAIKIYDKLNRKYYREAKNANKSVSNYIMSLIK